MKGNVNGLDRNWKWKFINTRWEALSMIGFFGTSLEESVFDDISRYGSSRLLLPGMGVQK